MENIAWIDDDKDPELSAAWTQLEAIKGSAAGWQYRGSGQTNTGWVHHFLNKYLRDEAESAEDDEASLALIPASSGWTPTL